MTLFFGDVRLNMLVDVDGYNKCHGQLSPTHSSNGDIDRVTEIIDCMNQRVAIWKATKKGERPLHPNFGCCIRDYLNEPLTGSRLLDLKSDVQIELSALFPEFNVKVTQVTSSARNQVDIESTIGNFDIVIPANAGELQALNNSLNQALSDLRMVRTVVM